jgi:hypothetical protein
MGGSGGRALGLMGGKSRVQEVVAGSPALLEAN